MKICIVVGHTEKAQGAHNQAFNKSEYEFNKELVTHITPHLKHEYKVFVNKELNQLPKAINDYDPTICVNLHCNAFNKLVSGTETLYFQNSTKGEALADILQDKVVGCLDLRDRGLKEITGNERGGFILRKTKCPCVILEPGFIDNDVDLMVMENLLPVLGKEIAEGINTYLDKISKI